MRSRYRCSMCPAIHINSRSWLRSSSTHEPSDPPLRVFQPFQFSVRKRASRRRKQATVRWRRDDARSLLVRPYERIERKKSDTGAIAVHDSLNLARDSAASGRSTATGTPTSATAYSICLAAPTVRPGVPRDATLSDTFLSFDNRESCYGL